MFARAQSRAARNSGGFHLESRSRSRIRCMAVGGCEWSKYEESRVESRKSKSRVTSHESRVTSRESRVASRESKPVGNEPGVWRRRYAVRQVRRRRNADGMPTACCDRQRKENNHHSKHQPSSLTWHRLPA